MQKTIIAAAVAGLLAMPAFAQTRVVLSGKINAAWSWDQAKGAAVRGGDIKMRDRMLESGSEFHIKAYEDLGNGNTAFVDIQTAVDIFNSNNVSTPDAGRLASRRAAIGLQGKWGMLQLGKWDLHYHAQIWGGTGPNASLNQMYGAVSLLNQIGGRTYATLGCRCDNTIRYVTPNFSGFEVGLGYTRNGGTGMNAPASATSGEQAFDPGGANKVDRAYSIQANYKNGGFKAMVAYWNRQNAIQGANLRDEYSIRAGLAYTFDFGLTLGVTYDYANMEVGPNGGAKVKNHRSAFVIPVYYQTGPHQINAAYGWASDLSNVDDSGAQYWTINYGYSISKRTTFYAGFAQYRNERNASYDFWSNTAVGLAAPNPTTGFVGNMGADPTSFAIGMIHSF